MFQLSFGKPELRITEVVVDQASRRVTVAAQPDGLVAAILRLIGISGHALFKADALGCRSESSSFTGQVRTYSAWRNVAACTFATTKATGYLAAAFSMMAPGTLIALASRAPGGAGSGAGPLTIVFFLLAVGAFVLFMIKRSIVFGIVTSGGTAELMKLKGSMEQMQELKVAVKLVESLMRGDGQEEEDEE